MASNGKSWVPRPPLPTALNPRVPGARWHASSPLAPVGPGPCSITGGQA